MLLSVWHVLVALVCAADAGGLYHKRLIHGNTLTLSLPERTEKLEFITSDESDQYVIWEQKVLSIWPSKPIKGTVSSVNDGWTFKLKPVTFDDVGTYILRNHFGSTISRYTVTVETNREIIDRVAGETLTIPLAGVKQMDATLRFYGNYSTIVLVENGVPVGKSHLDYISRLKVSSDAIQILNVNVSDIGRYVLTDHQGRFASNNTMILVDHHAYSSNLGLIALLTLGIPGGICFCCRKRICKGCRKKQSYSNPAQIPLSSPCSVPMTDTGVPGAQGYVAGYPANPDQGPMNHPPPDWSGQPATPPNAGFQPGYVPPNPVYPPEPLPGGLPAQPPHWNPVPPQYNPSGPAVYNPGNVPTNPVYPSLGPGASPSQPPPWNPPPTQYSPSVPMNYTPVMSSDTGPPTVPLLTPQPESHQPSMSGASMDILNSADSSIQFDINKGKSSGNNFL